MKTSFKHKVLKWYKDGKFSLRYRTLLARHFSEVDRSLRDAVGKYRLRHVYNLLKGKAADWNPLCSHPGCNNAVGFKDNFLEGYKPYCCMSCSANDPALKARRASTNLEKYGCANAASSQLVKAKIARTSKRNDSYAKAELTRRQTLLARTGGLCTNVSQLQGVQDKVKHTNLERYGVLHANQQAGNRKEQSERMRANGSRQALKGRDTIIKEHGVDNPMKIPGAVSRREAKYLEKYGVTNPMHRPEVFAKSHKAFHRTSDFRYRGETFSVQGYEREQIQYLCEIGFNVKSLRQDFNPISYTVGRKAHKYYPDLVVANRKNTLIVETKSSYTAWETGRKLRPEVLRKARAAIKEHKNFLLLIFAERGAQEPKGFYLVKRTSKKFRKLRYSTKVEQLPDLLRVFM